MPADYLRVGRHPVPSTGSRPEAPKVTVAFSTQSGPPDANAEWICDSGANTVVVEHAVCDMDPGEPANIRILLAFEWTQAAPQSCRFKDIALINM